MNLRLAGVSGKYFFEPISRGVSGLSRAVAGRNDPANHMGNQSITSSLGLSQPLDLFLLSSGSLLGPRAWTSNLDDSRRPSGSGNLSVNAYSVYPVWKSFGSSAAKSLSVQRQLHQLDDVKDVRSRYSHDSPCEENIIEIFDKVVGPFSTEPVWCEIFEHGPVRFKRRVDHRLMTFKSLMIDRSASDVSTGLSKALSGAPILGESVSNDPVLDPLAACDLLIMDPQTSNCSIPSPYARCVLEAYHSQLSVSTGGIFRKFKRRFLGI